LLKGNWRCWEIPEKELELSVEGVTVVVVKTVVGLRVNCWENCHLIVIGGSCRKSRTRYLGGDCKVLVVIHGGLEVVETSVESRNNRFLNAGNIVNVGKRVGAVVGG
jgi:hypothetical protein